MFFKIKKNFALKIFYLNIYHTDTDEPLVSSAAISKPIGFIQAVLLPGVIMYSLCYAFLKMVNYSFLFWLPFYLSNKFHWSETSADQISIWYDVGSIVGKYSYL